MSRLDLRRPVVFLALAGCASASGATGGGPAEGPRSSTPTIEVVSLHGPIALDPRANFAPSEGEASLHVFLADGTVFDGLVCFPSAEHCGVVELQRGASPAVWSATLSEALPESPRFTIGFEVPGGDWRSAPRVEVRVVAEGLGEIGRATATTSGVAAPPDGLRERLRGEQRLRRVYETFAIARDLADPSSRSLPASQAATPPSIPCAPTWVREADALSWLGLRAPDVLSWSFSLESDAADESVRVIARRDLDCHGTIETLVLGARLDENGSFERGEILRSVDGR